MSDTPTPTPQISAHDAGIQAGLNAGPPDGSGGYPRSVADAPPQYAGHEQEWDQGFWAGVAQAGNLPPQDTVSTPAPPPTDAERQQAIDDAQARANLFHDMGQEVPADEQQVWENTWGVPYPKAADDLPEHDETPDSESAE